MTWPPKMFGEPLDAYGPLPDDHGLRGGDRVECTHGAGTLELGLPLPFNGVRGIHVHARMVLDDGSTCCHHLDSLARSATPAPITGYAVGMLF